MLQMIAAIVKSLKGWLGQRSETFTALCATEKGEVFTHADVLKAHAACLLVLALIGIGGAL